MLRLPPQECRFGYTENQVAEIVGDRFHEFKQYMLEQTQAECDGHFCDGEAHGKTTYGLDIARFLLNKSHSITMVTTVKEPPVA